MSSGSRGQKKIGTIYTANAANGTIGYLISRWFGVDIGLVDETLGSFVVLHGKKFKPYSLI